MKPTILSAIWLLLITMVTSGWAQLSDSQIQLIDGKTITGSIESVARDGLITGKGIPEGLNLEQLQKIKTSAIAQPQSSRTLSVGMVGGGHFEADKVTVNDEKVILQSPLGLGAIKLESANSFVWNKTARVEEMLSNRSPENDRVIVQTSKNERVVEGLLESIDATHVSINYKGESRKISIGKVNAVVSADLGLATSEGSLATVELVDGSVVKGRLRELSNNIVTFELPGRNNIQFGASFISKIQFASGNLVFLSDLDPVSVQQKSLFGVARQWQRNLSIKGGALVLGGTNGIEKTKYEKGVGVQSYSELTFENDNGFDRFRAVVGIDFDTMGKGDCVASVDADGIRLWSQRITASTPPVEVSVDITGSKQVALVVEPGEEFDLGDHVDWALARFTKSK